MKRGIILLFLFYSFCLFGQGEIVDKTVLLIRNERSGAVQLNSNGWGGTFIYAKRVDYFNKTLYCIDFCSLRDLKEYKWTSDYDGHRFVYGKLNSCFITRFTYGHQKKIFDKFDKEGLAIHFFYTAGISFAICKPYYYLVLNKNVNISGTDTTITYVQSVQKFDPNANIVSRSSFITGLNQISAYPGLCIKSGLSFEFGKKDEIINALEVGAGFDAFTNNIPIMADNLNQWYYFTLSISYRFGVLIDNSVKKEKKKKKDNNVFLDEQYL